MSDVPYNQGRSLVGDAGRQAHWENVYTTKGENEVSWFQQSPVPSLDLIAQAGATSNSAIIDIGGGASRLVDNLVEQGFEDITVLDLSAAALAAAKSRLESRLGAGAQRVSWIVADATSWEPVKPYNIWHDRAAFHFLTDAGDRAAYIARLKRGLKIGGHAIIATFAPDGPEKCSGLPVARYDSESLGRTLGTMFKLVHTQRHEHATPWGSRQIFQFSVFRREG
ncbi:class I SAM-dependent methyltransferase [Bradyrhizobium australiense]|uniref:Class I SAM-dependent methyltransferase n=1 Tax=Bradyrhizobium australiense TaxID=2721161 RepID=A0A7Y4GRJ7_9BRAD|nr:class I SAM-dependent methyltransferase [Bradyrhizobium australiense]NOJ40674.1 class I SAM-dependent methyltransferase [Bradyrhizobium australiense]